MNPPSAAPISAGPASSVRPDDDLRLHGRSLLFARAGFLVVAALVIVLGIIALPSTYAVTFTPQELAGLRHANFSPALYAAITVAENAVGQLAYLAIALLLFWRRSDDRMALFGALMLLTVGGIIASGVFDSNTGSVVPALASPLALRVLASLLFVLAQSSLITYFYRRSAEDPCLQTWG